MEKIVKKLLITNLILVLVMNFFLPIANKKSEALEYLSDGDLSSLIGKKDLLEDLHTSLMSGSMTAHMYDGINELDFYVDQNAANSGRATLGPNGNLRIYDRSTIYIKLHDSNRGDYKTSVLAKYGDGRYKELNVVEGLNPIYLSWDELEREAPGSTSYELVTTKIKFDPILWTNEYVPANEKSISVTLLKNDIKLAGNNAGITNNYTQCNCAALEYHKYPIIYLKPNESVTVTSYDALKKDPKPTYERILRENQASADIFSISGNTITATGTPGDIAGFLYECDGSSTFFYVETSTMASGTCQLKRGKYEEGDFKYKGYNICKQVGVSFNEKKGNTTIELVVDSQFESTVGKIKPYDVDIEDMTGCLRTKTQIRYTDNSCVFTLDTPKNGKKDGVIKVAYLDYLNNRHVEYWRLYNCDYVNVVNEIKPKVIQNSSSSSSSNTGYLEEDAGCEIVIPDIPVQLTWNRSESGNSVIYELTAENSEHTCYTVVKRSNVNIPCNKNANYTFYYGNGNNVHTVITVDKLTNEQGNKRDDGVYDVIVSGENETGRYTAIIDTIWAGESHSLKTPRIMAKNNGTTDEKTGSITFDFETENCSEVKYMVIKRANPDVQYDTSILDTYDGFQGTKTKDPNNFSITISPNQTGGGYYDIVLYGINRSLYNEEAYIYSPIDVQRIFVDAAPQITISKVGDKNTKTYQQYKLEGYSTDKDSIAVNRYYVRKKLEKSDVVLPSADDMKDMSMAQEGDFYGDFTSGDILELDKNKIGGGYYDIIVYSEDEYGVGRFEYVQNIKIADDPQITYEIQDETDDKHCSIANRYTQKVDVKLFDDIATKYDIEYCYTPDDITEGEDKAIDFDILRKDAKYKISKIENVNVGDVTTLTLEAIKDVDEDYYLYIYAKPKDVEADYVQVMRTGSIRLDGTELELQTIRANKERTPGQAVGYKAGETLEIPLTFNREIDENVNADLYINIGNNEVKQNSVRVEGNKAIYSYEFDQEYSMKYITTSRIDYRDKFYAKNTTKCFYEESIKPNADITDIVSGYYYVDNVKPEVQSIILNVETDASNVKYDGATNTNYISNYDNVTLKMKYNERVVGNPAGLFLIKGNKYAFYLFGMNQDDEDERREDEYDIMEVLSMPEVKKYEGEVVLDDFFGGMESTEDLAGNEIELPENPEVTYMINGESIGDAKLVFDERVYEPEIYTSETKIKEDGTYVPNTVFSIFAEYDDEVKCTDLSGVTKVQLDLYYNSEQNICDCSGSIVFPDYRPASDKDDFLYKATYLLNEDQLPITIKPNLVGRYYVKLHKEDYAGNTADLEKEINISTSISFNEEECKFENLDNDAMVPIQTTTEEDRQYTVALNLEDVDTSDISVYVINKKTKRSEELELIADKDPDTNVAKYKLNVDRAGKYTIMVRDQDDKIIFYDFLRIYNVVLIGDANFDGVIDGLDTINILRYIVKMEGYYTDEIEFVGDVNHDGYTDVSDVVLLSRYIVQDEDVERTADGYYRQRGN